MDRHNAHRVFVFFLSSSRRTCSTRRAITSLLMLAGISPAGDPHERRILSTTPSTTCARISPGICIAEPFTGTGRRTGEGAADSAAKYCSSCRLNSSDSSGGSTVDGASGIGPRLRRDRKLSRTAVVLAAASASFGSILRSADIGGYCPTTEMVSQIFPLSTLINHATICRSIVS